MPKLMRARFARQTHDLYEAVVARARDPWLYRELGVADDLDGRFDLVVLHACLVLRRLRRCGAAGADEAQRLFDLMFADFDRSLRAMGVGDFRVGGRIRRMAQAFYGRARAYDEALDAGDGDGMRSALAEALRRNLFGKRDPGDDTARRAARYVASQESHLASLRDGELLAGRVSFDTAAQARGGAPLD